VSGRDTNGRHRTAISSRVEPCVEALSTFILANGGQAVHLLLLLLLALNDVMQAICGWSSQTARGCCDDSSKRRRRNLTHPSARRGVAGRFDRRRWMSVILAFLTYLLSHYHPSAAAGYIIRRNEQCTVGTHDDDDGQDRGVGAENSWTPPTRCRPPRLVNESYYAGPTTVCASFPCRRRCRWRKMSDLDARQPASD